MERFILGSRYMIDMSKLETQEKVNIEQLKQEMGPIKPSQILRMSKLKQCIGEYTDGKGNYCAIGAMMKFLGWNDEMRTEYEYFKKVEGMMNVGLVDASGCRGISHWNDDLCMTFEQIADKLEEMGY